MRSMSVRCASAPRRQRSGSAGAGSCARSRVNWPASSRRRHRVRWRPSGCSIGWRSSRGCCASRSPTSLSRTCGYPRGSCGRRMRRGVVPPYSRYMDMPAAVAPAPTRARQLPKTLPATTMTTAYRSRGGGTLCSDRMRAPLGNGPPRSGRPAARHTMTCAIAQGTRPRCLATACWR